MDMAEETPLSPQQAAQALAGLAGYEESLSARVGALTGMVWGVVSAAIFVTYALAPQVHPMWVMTFLWVPWTVAGIIITTSAWKLHAISLRRQGEGGGRSWMWSVGFAMFFLVALTALHFLPLPMGAANYMVVINGLAAFIIVVAVSRKRHRLAPVPLLVAGVLMIAAAFALAATPLDEVGMALASAGVVGGGWIGSGLLSFVRG